MTTWFTSDPHFDHFKIIRYCNRPFENLDHMHQVLQDNWNQRVTPDDEVWVLGDFVLGSFETGALILDSLHGTKHLIMGNHDRHSRSAFLRMGFKTVQKQAVLDFIGEPLRMSHFPPRHEEKPQISLCGHVHDRWTWDPERLTLNVGVDVWDFSPISEATIVKTIREKL